jgi:hypothetical protein
MGEQRAWDGRWRLAGDLDSDRVVQELVRLRVDAAIHLWLDGGLFLFTHREYPEPQARGCVTWASVSRPSP